jgi:biotin-dependent carboxylase-like uncharacterized protein
MTPVLDLLATGPGVSVQDLGRPGHLATGLSTGGAADRRALFEAAALLGQPAPLACLELAGYGGRFRVGAPTRIALTGAPMRATLDGAPLRWHAAHLLPAGAVLDIGAAEAGSYGYLSFAGGIATPEILGARSAHLAAGIGARLAAGDCLPLGPDPAPGAPLLALPAPARFQGGTVRVIAGPQTALFPPDTRARFFATPFTAGRGNRQGLALPPPDAPFAADAPPNLVSDLIVPGDIQMTGAGVPMVLLCECQTVGGYPRIGTVIPADLGIVAQAAPGTVLRFAPVTLEVAEAASPPESRWIATLRAQAQPLIRSPHDIPDLLGYQLISGAVRGDEPEEDSP